MPKQSAGILVFRRSSKAVEVLLVHPAGPIWGYKDVWSIPKGELDGDEDHLTAARREFLEELSMPPPDGELIELGQSRQSSGKVNFIWAIEGDLDLTNFASNTFTMVWPPRSGITAEFPENDRAEWFDIATAKQKVFPDQIVFFDRLAAHLNQ
jgi:predicted NUDIX family NTP pyrophosphohydrolase